MGENLQRPDIIAQATLIETPARGRLSVDQQLAQQIQQQVAKENAENPRGALEGFKNKLGVPPEKVKNALDTGIGTERDPHTGQKILNGPETTRRNTAQTNADLARKFIDQGIDNLNGQEINQLADQLVNVVNSWDQGREILKNMSPPERRVVAITMLRKPEMAPFIQKALNNALEQLPKEVDKELVGRHREAQEARVDAEAKRNKIDGERNKAQTEVDKYESKQPNTPGKDLSELKNKEASWQQQESRFSKEIRDIDRRIAGLQQDISTQTYRAMSGIDVAGVVQGLRQQIQQLEQDRDGKQDKLDDITKERSRYEALLQEKATAEAKLEELETKFEEADEAFKKTDRSYAAVNADMNLAKIDRAKAEEAFVKGIQDAAAEGMLEYLTKTTETNEKAAQTIIDQQKNEAKEKADVAITSAMSNRWNTEKTFKRLWWSSKVWEPNKQQINIDMEYVLNEPATGPKDLLGAIMADAGVPVDVIQEKLKDQAWLDKNIPQVMERVVARGIQAGKLKQGELRRIADTDWGKGLLNKAINQNREVRRQIDEGIANGVIRGDIGEFFAKTENKDILAALLAILGGAAGAIFAAPALAAAGIAGAGTAQAVGRR